MCPAALIWAAGETPAAPARLTAGSAGPCRCGPLASGGSRRAFLGEISMIMFGIDNQVYIACQVRAMEYYVDKLRVTLPT